MSVENTNSSQAAGKFVTISMAVIVGAIVGLLCFHIYQIESKYTVVADGAALISNCDQSCDQDTMRIALEQNSQVLITDRARTAMATRLAVHVVGEIVALVLVALGGVLIFDRIQSVSADELGHNGLTFRSVWPGVTLCLLGTIVVLFTLKQTNSENYKITVPVKPTYLEDSNRVSGLLQNLPYDENLNADWQTLDTGVGELPDLDKLFRDAVKAGNGVQTLKPLEDFVAPLPNSIQE